MWGPCFICVLVGCVRWCVGGVASRERSGARVGLGVAGCCFEPWRCVGSACNHRIGGAVGCRVGGKVGLGGAAKQRVELVDRIYCDGLNNQR